MYLAWDNPNCFDEIMIVASENPITAVPTSMDPNDYTPGAIFGTGTDAHNDFSGTESPVYRGTGNRVQVTGLTNGQLYYFQIFTFRSGVWQAGAQISATPEAGCSGLGDGATHQYTDLPIIVAGSGGGRFRTGQHLHCSDGTPLANLWLTQARIMGLPMHRFADSTGPVESLLV